MSKADWDEFRRKALAPRVRGPAWRPCNPNVALASYFPVVERWCNAAAEAYQQRDWETIWQGAPLGHRLAARHGDVDAISRYLVRGST